MIKTVSFTIAAICLISGAANAQDMADDELWDLETGKATFATDYTTDGPRQTFKASRFLSDCIGPVDYGGNKQCVSFSLNLWDEKLDLEYQRSLAFTKKHDIAVETDMIKTKALQKHQVAGDSIVRLAVLTVAMLTLEVLNKVLIYYIVCTK